jgi:hypothetical protein
VNDKLEHGNKQKDENSDNSSVESPAEVSVMKNGGDKKVNQPAMTKGRAKKMKGPRKTSQYFNVVE